MNIKTHLIYTGENFNLVLDNVENTRAAFRIAIQVLNEVGMTQDADMLSIDEANLKIYLTEGSIGNENNVVVQICRSIAKELKESAFYGHAFYDDDSCGYESCADYDYENGSLRITIIESLNGHGMCPECGEQVVCYDEYDPNAEYVCDECGAEIENHNDMFGDVLPKVTTIEEIIK